MCGPGFPDTPGRSCGELLHRRPAYEVVGAPVSSLQRAILKHMIDKRPQADRLLVAELHGEARHHARWRDLTEDEETAAVAELRELAEGRADLLAEVAGILEGTSEGELTSRSRARPRDCAERPGPTRKRSRDGSRRVGGGELTPACRRSQVASRCRG